MQIIDGRCPKNECPVIEVRLWPAPKNPSVTVASVRLVEVGGAGACASVVITPLVERKRMSRAEAIAVAGKAATERGIDCVYVSASKKKA
jgi:hypothetical protein